MSLTSSHLEWLHENNLPTYLYSDFANSLYLEYIPQLERSIKLNLNTGNILNQARYSISAVDASESISTQSICNFLKYTGVSNELLQSSIKSWYFPEFKHDWYVGIDDGTHKIGVDYHNNCIKGIAYKNSKLYFRRYDQYSLQEWYPQLKEYIMLYNNVIDNNISSAINYTIEKTVNLEYSHIYIKRDDDNLVWHFNCSLLNYPQFDFLLKPKFNEKFYWFSFDSNLTHLTLYIRPNFLLVD